jgi:excinuclease UvrABC nuclease subunit
MNPWKGASGFQSQFTIRAVIMLLNDLPKTFGIYKFTNKINGRIYIGKSNNLWYRIRRHLRKSSNQVIDKAIKNMD